jgi:endo-1,4-beta-mannosidase
MMFELGVNYWPIESAMAMWKRFNRAEVEDDFALISSAGLGLVRLFLLWEDFQPQPNVVSQKAIGDLVQVADIAQAHRLKIVPTFFTGHMSGVNFIPEWALSNRARKSKWRSVSNGRVIEREPASWFEDGLIMEQQALLVREVASALHDRPALWGWDLGNENSNVSTPSSEGLGLDWLERIAGAIRTADAAHPITIGLHQADLEGNTHLGPRESAEVLDVVSIHGYPMYVDWSRSPSDPMVVPFMGLLTRWLCGGTDVLFEELGAPTMRGDGEPWRELSTSAILDEDDAAVLAKREIEQLVRFGFRGAVYWCYGDYAEKIWDMPPLDEAKHERCFGLWHRDRTEKSIARELRRFSGIERKRPDERDLAWIDISSDEYWASPHAQIERLYRRFLERSAGV